MSLDLSLMTNSGDIVGILQAFNVYSNGWFGIVFTFVIPIIILIITSQVYDSKSSLLATSITLFIISLMFLAMSLITTQMYWIILTLTIVTFLVAIK